MIGSVRRWIARSLALLITVLTLGRVAVHWDGVDPASLDSLERPAITSTVDPSDDA